MLAHAAAYEKGELVRELEFTLVRAGVSVSVRLLIPYLGN